MKTPYTFCVLRYVHDLVPLGHKFAHVFLCRNRHGLQGRASPVYPNDEIVEIFARELPLKRLGNLLVVASEPVQPLFESLKRGEVIGCEGLALEDGEIDLDLIEPACVHGGVNGNDRRPPLLEAVHAGLAAMRRAVIHDPEDATGGTIRFLVHDLFHESAEWEDARLALAPTIDLCATDVPRGQIGPCAHALVLVLDAHRLVGSRWQRRVDAPSRLDAGLLVGREDEIIVAQGLPLPMPFVEIDDSSSLGLQVGITREDPAAMLPWTDGIFVQPAPDGFVADAGDDAGIANLARYVRHAHA